MADRKDWYFSKAKIEGAGDLFFLIMLREAGEVSDARNLVGSFAKEIDSGLLSKKCPDPSIAFSAGLAARQMLAAYNMAEGDTATDMIKTSRINASSQSSVSFKKFGLKGKGDIPGVPASLGAHLDYEEVSTVDVTFGPDSYFLELNWGYAEYGLKEIKRAKGAGYHSAFRDDDYMIVNRALIVRDLKVTVNAKSTFSAGVDAGLSGVAPGPNIGFNYDKAKKKLIEIEVKDGKDYLFGLSAIEAEKF